MTKTGVEIILKRGEYLPMSEGTQTKFFTYVDLTDLIGIEVWENVEAQAPTEAVRELLMEIEYISSLRPDIVPVDPEKPMIALTFDDGPSLHTERLLDMFKEHGARGTFFVVGNLIDSRHETVKRIYTEGHEIGNHSWSHRQLTKLDIQDMTDQIMMTKAKIFELTGFDCKIVRPPYGSYDDEVKDVAKDLGVIFVNWSIDTLDWKTKDADAVYNEIVGKVKDGDIVLCHDLHKTTVDAMEKVIPKLIEDGYQLVTVSQILSYPDRVLEDGKVYRKRENSIQVFEGENNG
jgi:peptidoglycan/xylan/chitin deacetylase (PgdA/CDA1 family)